MIQVESSIEKTIQTGGPVVALETAMLTHGLPKSHSMSFIHDVVKVISEEGAIPVFIAVVAGILRVGVTPDVLESIIADGNSLKTSSRDLPHLFVTKKHGGTTVASTLYAAHQVGIEFFATGGIGGAHQGVARSFDISADIGGLEKHPICVFTSGVKSVGDIPKTIEIIESRSIPVWGYQTSMFPEFFVRGTSPITTRVDRPQDIAALWRATRNMKLNTAALVCVEVPSDHAIGEDEYHSWHEQAIFDLVESDIRGKAVTPFLLDRIAELSEGKSLKANMALLLNNARIAAQTAVAFSNL